LEKESADACLFDTLFRTLGRLEPKWIVKEDMLPFGLGGCSF